MEVGSPDLSLGPFESGLAAAQEVATNVTQLLPHSNHILNGTSREIWKHLNLVAFTESVPHVGGILPITDLVYHLNNWTTIETLQQGLTADVSCREPSKSDPALSATKRATRYIFISKYEEITLSCGGNSSSDINQSMG